MKAYKVLFSDAKEYQDFAAFAVASIYETVTMHPTKLTVTIAASAYDDAKAWLDMEQIAAVVTPITWDDDEEREAVLDNPTTDADTIREIAMQKIKEMEDHALTLASANEELAQNLKKSQESADIRYKMWMREEAEKYRLQEALKAISTIIDLTTPTLKSNQ